MTILQKSKQKLRFLSSSPTAESEFYGQKVSMYPIPGRLFLEAEGLWDVAVGLLNDILSPLQTNGREETLDQQTIPDAPLLGPDGQQIYDEQGHPLFRETTTHTSRNRVEACTPQMVEVQAGLRRERVEKLVRVLLSEQAFDTFLGFVASSMRLKDDEDLIALRDADLGALVPLGIGFFEANKEAMRPLWKRLPDAVKDRAASAMSQVAETTPDSTSTTTE